MVYLLDTNILIRLTNADDQQHKVTFHAIQTLQAQGDLLTITPQVLVEFRAVATRPIAANGLGRSVQETEAKATAYATIFPLLEETPAIFPAWKSIVGTLGVMGKQVHDARLVAVCHAHGVTHLLTFNGAHFTRLARVGPGLIVVDPANV